MKRDVLFEKDTVLVGEGAFAFDRNVSEVFDDMARRCIPGYEFQQEYIVERMLESIRRQNGRQGCIIDFGCSTGETFSCLSERAEESSLNTESTTLYACDYSEDMLEECEKKLSPHKNFWREIHIVQLDLKESNAFLQGISEDNINIFAFNLHFVLQFIPLSVRPEIVSSCWEMLAEGGRLFIGEKLRYEDADRQTESEKMQYEFKRSQGYSEFAIEGKRKALEGVLIPQSYNDFFAMIADLPHSKLHTYYRQGEFVCVEVEKLPV